MAGNYIKRLLQAQVYQAVVPQKLGSGLPFLFSALNWKKCPGGWLKDIARSPTDRAIAIDLARKDSERAYKERSRGKGDSSIYS